MRKAAHEGAARQKKCASLERRRQRTSQDATAAAGKAAAKAVLKARRAAEDYEAQCGPWRERQLGLAR